MPPKKILVMTSTFPRWERDTGSPFIYEFSKRLLAYDFDVSVLAPHAPGAKTYEIMNGLKIYRYHYLPSPLETLSYGGGILSKLRNNKLNYFKIPFFLVFQLLTLIRIIKKEQYEILHAHWVIPQGLIAAIYKKFFNKKTKIVCTSHGSDLLGLKGFISHQLKNFVLKNIDTLTVVSSLLKEEALKFHSNLTIDILPMGVDIHRFTPDCYSENIKKKYNIQGPLLLFVGRLSEEKGIVYLLEALADVIKSFPATKLLIIGSGVLEKDIGELCLNLGLTKHVITLGHIPQAELPKYYATADIFIGPSVYEGFGLVFIEALSCGCCVVATDLPSITNIVIEGKTGFTVPIKNSRALRDKLLVLLKTPDLRESVKSHGREHIIKNFGWEVTIEKYAGLLHTI